MYLEARSPEHAITLPLVSKTEENSRLPLVVNVVTRYWGEDLYGALDGAAPAAQKGSVLIYGLEIAERRGFVSYIYRGSVKDLKKRVDQGIPPVVIMPGIRGIVQHAMIVSGYNEDERRILTYVPEPDTVGAIPEEKFEADWLQDNMTTIVIVPSDMQGLFRNESLQFARSNRLCYEAEALQQQNKTSDAIAKLLQATEIDKGNAQAWCLLGGAYNEIGDHRATSCYETAIKLNPRYYLAHRGLGNYFLKQADYSSAERCYAEAIAINPARYGPIYKNRAIARMQLAKQDLGTYLRQMPDAQDRKSIEQTLAEL